MTRPRRQPAEPFVDSRVAVMPSELRRQRRTLRSGKRTRAGRYDPEVVIPTGWQLGGHGK